MSVELHLPDLPEVPLSLGPAPEPAGARRVRLPWHLRLREAVATYAPLLLMGLLALGTWWLVKHTPIAAPPAAVEPPRADPDYTMTQFAIERFGADGRLRIRVEGDVLRHYPDTDRYEIEQARIRALSPEGRATTAHAARALANGDLSEVQLLGGAQVTASAEEDRPVAIRSDFLQADLVHERVRTHLPVLVSEGANELRAAGLQYDHGRRLLELQGRVRALLAPAAGAARNGAGRPG